jgi:hypothetical protein
LYKIGLGNSSRSTAGSELLSSFGLTLKLVLPPAACTLAPALAWSSMTETLQNFPKMTCFN